MYIGYCNPKSMQDFLHPTPTRKLPTSPAICVSKSSVTTVDGVGRAAVSILRKPEGLSYRPVRVSDAVVTQNRLFGEYKKILGEDGWTVERVSQEQQREQGYKFLEVGNHFLAFVFLVQSALWSNTATSYCGDYNDNEALGIQPVDVSQVVKASLQ
ncbi:hypothetical protein PROFUN_11669 [Planoprotostelium fungivorum]|uniref:Uncharacterized protein n=1 Tax=Planoprotostelium fungivorum TaxID=1890364 RepID=A0A2P6N589_9EUKA|nr:hypothetical protein PROFUN_11669 [Planoprotostelium fungivorum]